MADALGRFRRDYSPLMLRYLAQRDEAGLQAAYELGREAMRDSVGLLEVVRVHNELFLDVLSTARDAHEGHDLARASASLLIDLIASFEMSQRAFMDARRTGNAPTDSSD
jgi:Phosphoserine phosphatase RsbU, N-terminal domain